MPIETFLFCLLIIYSAILGLVIALCFRNNLPRTALKPAPVSLIIPLRNEEENLPDLVRSLSKILFPPSSEIIFINDNSTDNTAALLLQLKDKIPIQSRIVQNSGEGKKSAIETGVSHAVNEIIVTTDADCTYTPEWIMEMSSANKVKTLTMGLVWIKPSGGMLSQLQVLEQFALNAFGIFFYKLNRSVYCSGANLMYTKEDFKLLNPYKTNSMYFSGDDYFMLEAFKQDPSRNVQLVTLEPTYVYTKNMDSLVSLLNQKVRWIKKMTHTTPLFSRAASLIILVYVLMPAIGLTLCGFSLISIKHFITLVLFKFGIDYLFLFLVALKFRQEFKPIQAVLVQPIYPVYVLAVLFFTLAGNLQWKNRTIKY